MSREVYDKVYFNDDYSKQFSELRGRYHDRTQAALKGRKKDTAPMPNATTIVLMEDLPDGGVTITTGDFISYYKERCGYDRLGETRKSLSQSRQKAEMRAMREKTQRSGAKAEADVAKKRANAVKKHAVRRCRFSFVHALLGMLLILSMVMFFGTSALLDNTVEELREMKSEVAVMQSNEMAVTLAEELEVPASTTLSGADSVEVYEPIEEEEGFSVMALLNALASLGKKE